MPSAEIADETGLISRRDALRMMFGVGGAILLSVGCATKHSAEPQPSLSTIPELPSATLAPPSTANSEPQPSQGQRLIFSSDQTGFANIWMRQLASGELTNLTQKNANYFNPKPSPDTNNMVLCTDEFGQQTQIATYNFVTKALTRLTHDNEHYYWDPAYMPDGRIIYKQASASDLYGDIGIMNPDGSEARLLTDYSKNKIEAWAPAPIDNSRIVIGLRLPSAASTIDQLTILDIKSGNMTPMPITTSSLGCWYPTVNHKTGRIGYVTGEDIFSMDQAGTSGKLMSPNISGYSFRDPAWVAGGDSMVCVAQQLRGGPYSTWLVESRDRYQVLDQYQGQGKGDLGPILF